MLPAVVQRIAEFHDGQGRTIVFGIKNVLVLVEKILKFTFKLTRSQAGVLYNSFLNDRGLIEQLFWACESNKEIRNILLGVLLF